MKKFYDKIVDDCYDVRNGYRRARHRYNQYNKSRDVHSWWNYSFIVGWYLGVVAHKINRFVDRSILNKY